MNLHEGTRRLLILALLLWSPVALYMVWGEWPKPQALVTFPDREAVEVGDEFLRHNPLTAEQIAEYRKTAAEYLRRNPDFYPPGLMRANEGINLLALQIAAQKIVDEHWELRLQVWFRKRADVWQALGLYLVLPIAAAFAFLKLVLPVLSWVFAGFKSAAKPED